MQKLASRKRYHYDNEATEKDKKRRTEKKRQNHGILGN